MGEMDEGSMDYAAHCFDMTTMEHLGKASGLGLIRRDCQIAGRWAVRFT